MERRTKGAFFRLIFAAVLCSLFLGLTMTTEETDGCADGHDSGTLTLVNATQYNALVNLAGPIASTEFIPPGESLSLKTRAGFYHWAATFGAGPFPLMDWEVDAGVVTVKKGEASTVTIKKSKNN